MTTIIILLASLMVFIGIALLIKPTSVLNILKQYGTKKALYISAITARLLLGCLLISQATASSLPLTVELLGWLIIIAAIILMVIGHSRFQKLLISICTHLSSYNIAGGSLAIIFGGFLIYVFT